MVNYLSQDCIEARQDLEDRLARLQLAYEDAQAALAQCHSGVENDPATFGSLGSLVVLLSLLYLAGVYWRKHFGSVGPAFPLDR